MASLQLEPSLVRRYVQQLVTGKSLLQIALAAVAAVLLLLMLEGWRPPFAYREGQIPERDVVARVAFDMVDAQQTKMLRDQKRREVLCYYENRSQPITQLRGAIKDQIFSLLGDKSFEELESAQLQTLEHYLPSQEGADAMSGKEALAQATRTPQPERTTRQV